jgi:hypothetical protein
MTWSKTPDKIKSETSNDEIIFIHPDDIKPEKPKVEEEKNLEENKDPPENNEENKDLNNNNEENIDNNKEENASAKGDISKVL